MYVPARFVICMYVIQDYLVKLTLVTTYLTYQCHLYRSGAVLPYICGLWDVAVGRKAAWQWVLRGASTFMRLKPTVDTRRYVSVHCTVQARYTVHSLELRNENAGAHAWLACPCCLYCTYVPYCTNHIRSTSTAAASTYYIPTGGQRCTCCVVVNGGTPRT